MRAPDQQTVRGLQLFADMREAHFRALMNAALLQTFPPRVLLIREGELPDFLHVLVDGSVELLASHRKRETTIEILVPTTTFILAAVILDEVHLKSARTLTESRVLMIPAGAVRDVFGRDGAFARAVVGELALRYRGIVRALKSQKLRTGAERLANWILEADARDGSAGRVSPAVREAPARFAPGNDAGKSFAQHRSAGVPRCRERGPQRRHQGPGKIATARTGESAHRQRVGSSAKDVTREMTPRSLPMRATAGARCFPGCP